MAQAVVLVRQIYLDYNASTPIAPEVRDAMLPYLSEGYGNPSTTHWAGKPAREAVDRAREQIAALLGCLPEEIVFTSGGTESNNHALKGTFYAHGGRGHIITTQVEHPAIIEPCRFLERLGAEVTCLPVDSTGLVDPDDVRAAIRPDTILVSVMYANNEVGTVEPIEEIGAICRERDVPLHTDAAQAIGKIPAKVDELGVDLLSIAGHKLYAPKGVGALYIREGTIIEPFMHGAGHEEGRRAGTENVLLDVGLGSACELAEDLSWTTDLERLRDRFWQGLQERFDDSVQLNGHHDRRLPNTLSVAFAGRVGGDILAAMPEVAASTGSACHSGEIKLSPVLKAMNVHPEAGLGTIRFSLGRSTRWEDLEHVLGLLGNLLGHGTD